MKSRKKKDKTKISVPRIQAERGLVPKGRILYWAYGSNLNVAQMARRCPKAKVLAAWGLDDCALVFRGVADVTVRKGARTPGGLWTITTECEAALDRYEGVASRLYMKRYVTVKVDGVPHPCLVYQMRTSRGIMPPTRAYLDTIMQGYADFGITDERMIQAALDESWDDKEVTSRLQARHKSLGSPRLAKTLRRPSHIEEAPSFRQGGGDQLLLPAPMWTEAGEEASDEEAEDVRTLEEDDDRRRA
jgi:hypothetical protein